MLTGLKKIFQIYCLLTICLFTFSCTNNELIEQVESTFENGQRKTVIFYRGQEENKEKMMHYYESGAVRDEIPYVNNKLEGIWTMYYENGNKRLEGTYIDNLANGSWKYYYETGEISSEGIAKDDIWQGKYIWYRQSGIKLKEGTYLDGKLDGDYIFYDEDGNQQGQVLFQNGVKVPGHPGTRP